MANGVTVAEREMVDLAVALVDGSDPRLHVRRLQKAGRETGLSRTAFVAIERVLSRGVAASLAAGGGVGSPWSPEGVPLRFGPATLDLLHWLHTAEVHAPARTPLELRAPMTPLDAMLAARGVELLAAAGAPIPRAWHTSPWCWLLVGELLVQGGAAPVDLDWRPVFAQGQGSWIDAVPRRLERVWRAWIRRARAGDVADTIAHGDAQEAILRAYLAASDRHDRIDFVVRQLPELAALDAGVWQVQRGDAAVSAWHRARRARVAAVRVVVAHLDGLERRWRSVGFVDDEYDEAQQGLRRFEGAFEAAHRLAAPIAAAERLDVPT